MALVLQSASPERFSRLDGNPDADLERIGALIAAGRVAREHLLVVADEVTADDTSIDERGAAADAGRACLMTLEDGTRLAQAFRVDRTRTDLAEVYRLLLDGVAGLASAEGADRVHTTVVEELEPAVEAKRAGLVAAGWAVDSERLELGAAPSARPRDPSVVEVDPQDPAVLDVIAAAMADSLDDYDREQVAALGAPAAAAAYRDMLVGGSRVAVPWFGHRGERGLDGVGATEGFDADWSLGYLGVIPSARRRGVGRALVSAMISATAAAGVPLVTASVAVGNVPVRRTLEGLGLTVRSRRTDHVRLLDGGPGRTVSGQAEAGDGVGPETPDDQPDTERPLPGGDR